MIDEFIEEVISPFEELLGKKYLPYKNHVHRISFLTMKLKRELKKDDEKKIAIAAVFHDIGIWTANTFDYLPPSIEAAKEYLLQNNLSKWSEEISLIIDMHHKRSVYRGKFADNVESFRRADLIDVTKGRQLFGLEKKLVKENYQRFPMLGFRGLIIRMFFKNLGKNLLNPLPMMKK